ncbi:MAG: hypothetical protein MRJ96_09380 [Nitrospirales bacterium]|nr:hypothetical protein [Nitrospira sp.]MDR4501645.1 hypothetical protein [Nitrospirales bacterium]
MSEIVKPSVQAFLVCDTIIIDSLTGKKSIIGAFSHLWAKTFPCQHPQMGVYFCLTDAEGAYQFEIELVYLDKNQTVGKGAISPIQIKNRLETHDFGLNISTVVLPGPGRYEFRLHANGQFITQKDFYVIQQEAQPTPSTSERP